MIERNQAIEIARKRAAEKGWRFVEPLEVIIRRNWLGFGGTVKRFEIETSVDERGTQAHFTIDAKRGKIVSEWAFIGRDQAIEIARKRAEENGWIFDEPLDVIVRHDWSGPVRHFEIKTHAGYLGTKARFTIDAKTGKIIHEGYIPY